MSHTRVTLTNPAYPPLTADLYETTPTVNGQVVKINVGVVNATRVTSLTTAQAAQIITDVHADYP